MSTAAVIEPRVPSSWSEDFLLVALLALVGVLGMCTGVATGSQAEGSVGLIFVLFAARVLGDVLRQRSAQNA
jgi:hypothetical protein